MKEISIDILLDAAAEIMLPDRCGMAARHRATCVCCGRAGQPMDDDGCGICDACLESPLRAADTPDGLDFPAAFPHLSFTARRR